MKKLFVLIPVIISVLLCFGCGDKKQDSPEGKTESSNVKKEFSGIMKRYGIKSGIVEYEISGSQKGKKTLYFDDYGLKQAEHSSTVLSIAGFTKKSNLINIIDNDYQYMIDLDQKSGTKMKIAIIEELKEKLANSDLIDIGKEMFERSGATLIGKEKVAGKECDVYEVKKLGTKTWYWNWVVLKNEINTSGIKIKIEAVKVIDNADIPEDKLSVPKGIVLSEVDFSKMQQQMGEEPKEK
ncbi:MAG: hypothetical protein HXY49_07175 [Ignavibacteriaceae bacterium]|nr:hypothetical protein [Ignavibacteriaceae bacterium]